MRNPKPARISRLLVTFAVSASLVLAGCRAHVDDLTRTPAPPQYRPLAAYTLVAGVTGPDGRRALAGSLEEGLADFLSNERVFEDVVFPYQEGSDDVDVVLQVDARGDFSDAGGANFWTYLPGGLILLPTFRGVRFTYEANARVTAIDARSGQPIGRYEAATVHRSIDRGSPFHFLGTLLVVPSLIQGIRNSSPRRPYTDMLYAQAYPALWRQVSAQIVAQESEYAAIGERSRARRRYAQPGGGWQAPPPGPTWGSPGRVSPPPPPVAPIRPEEYGELYSKQVAVVVGIESYQRWPNVGGARADAQRMAAHLRGSGFDPVIEVYDRDATRQRMLEVLGNELGQSVDGNALVFVYFAGHGDTETLPGGSKRGYLIPWDADDDVFSSGISMDTVRDLSNRMTAKHVLYAVDACYSGIPRTRGIRVPQRADNDYLRKITKKRAVQLLVAGSEGEQPVAIGGQSVFTSFLLRGMSGEADIDGDGAVTASELKTFVVPGVTRASGARQTPQLNTMEGGGEVVFLSP